ncbi:MAG TPA: chloride channel protein [Terriglobales bacterium]|nr:chloride channel protein [Terriglobales bacterium]
MPVGAIAAIAAAFNMPLAAVLFALEEIVGDLHAPVIGAVVLCQSKPLIGVDVRQNKQPHQLTELPVRTFR